MQKYDVRVFFYPNLRFVFVLLYISEFPLVENSDFSMCIIWKKLSKSLYFQHVHLVENFVDNVYNSM